MDKEKILHKIITVMAFSIILSLSLSSMGCGRSVEIKDVDTRADISSIDRTDDGRIIDSILSYEDAEHLPPDMPFVSQEALELVRDIYEAVGSAGTYGLGTDGLLDYYKNQFTRLFEGKVTLYDPDGEESLLMDRYDIDDYRYTANARFYFFDMDGDGAPELCIEGNGGRSSADMMQGRTVIIHGGSIQMPGLRYWGPGRSRGTIMEMTNIFFNWMEMGV